ncbi:MAG: penicillin-binding transpeptidase domain-containing protein [Gammaproteobacteria bacterium]|nr:penicillin-binding transpeptidase domain-containing protein [Gammaproteobacteria bacterium]
MSSADRPQKPAFHSFVWRLWTVSAVLLLAGGALVTRAIHLQVFNTEFLNKQAAARHLRVATLSATRGVIKDRNGEPLAVSTPVDSVWVNPPQLLEDQDRIRSLARALKLDTGELTARLSRKVSRGFYYVKRHMNPSEAAAIDALQLPGVHLLREYRRYYPAGEVTGHLLGFTNIDDKGQEGLELAFDNWLHGVPGKKKVLRDRLGRVIEDVESIVPPSPGRDLVTSIDLRIQYLAYRELKAAVQKYQAASGSVIVLDVATGEVLADVNQPAFNPNDRSQIRPAMFRNRAITDILEPGSTFKPLIVAAALDSGRFTARSRIDTSPGFVQVGAKTIEDKQNYGVVDLATLLAKSSNVGAVQVAMKLDKEMLWSTLSRFGAGHLTSSGYPGESAGMLPPFQGWRPIGQATMAYGYGISMTPLQLAQAYAVLAGDGLHRPISLVRVDKPPIARRVVSPETAHSVVGMLEQVVTAEGTGIKARVTGYRVAGKTGTARKVAAGGYSQDRHTAVFSGIAPATAPRLVIVVVVDEPKGAAFYGGDVSAPVFAAVATGALRILAVPPDGADAAVSSQRTQLAASAP